MVLISNARIDTKSSTILSDFHLFWHTHNNCPCSIERIARSFTFTLCDHVRVMEPDLFREFLPILRTEILPTVTDRMTPNPMSVSSGGPILGREGSRGEVKPEICSICVNRDPCKARMISL